MSAEAGTDAPPARHAPAEYTIDDLAAATGVPARTIRYYQAEGVLPPPRRQGRVALYGAEHVERLELVARLKARGLQLGAIADLVAESRVRGRTVEEWVGLKDRVRPDWPADAARDLDRAEALARAGSDEDLDELIAAGIVAEAGPGAVRVEHPPLLEAVLRLSDHGFSLAAVARAYGIVLRHADVTARELVERCGTERGFLAHLAPDEAAIRGSELCSVTAEVAGRLLLARVDRVLTGERETAEVP